MSTRLHESRFKWPQPPAPKARCLWLINEGGDTYVFRFLPHQRRQIIRKMARMALSPWCGFSVRDFACLYRLVYRNH